MPFQLRVSIPGLPEMVLRLAGPGPWTVGSSPECDVPLRARGTSRRHLELSAGPGETLRFMDLGSTNGTLLDGKRAPEGIIGPGRTLQAGEAVLRAESAGTEAFSYSPALADAEFRSLLEVRPVLEPPSATAGETPDLEAFAAFLESSLSAVGAASPWSGLCQAFCRFTGCAAAKAYAFPQGEGEGAACVLRGAAGLFQEGQVSPELAQACALMPQAAVFSKRGGDSGPVALLSLPIRKGDIRAVFLGVLPEGADPIRARPETLALCLVLFRLALGWAEELEEKGRAVASLRTRIADLASREGRTAGEPILGESPALRAALELADRAAPTGAPVLLLGETGAGKELFAQRIHRLSERASGPFLALNCTAIPEALLESELFGAARGAFTGCTRDLVGKFEAASGGTLFLDEVGDMPVVLQGKLLRVLDEKRVTPLGSNRPRAVDARIVSATNRDLAQAIREKRFREDLYYRLATVVVEIPPLRDRREDVPLLAHAFLEAANREFGRRVLGFEEGALLLLRACAWPGNVRELMGLVKSLVIRAKGSAITEEMVVASLGKPDRRVAGPSPGPWDMPWAEAKDAFEREYVTRRLAAHRGSVTALAREMGIARVSLYDKLKKLGLRGE